MTKTARKAKASKSATRGFTLAPESIGKIVDSSTIKMERRRVSTKYVPIVNKVLDLKVGQAFTLPVPKDTTSKKFRTTVSTTLRKRLEGQLPKGSRLRFGMAQNGDLVVQLAKE